MDLVRRLVTDAPAVESFQEVKPTLLICWWSTFYALTVIIIRTCGRYVRAEKVFVEDGIMMIAIVPLFIRMGLVHVVLLFGTNNVITTGLSAAEIHRREIGSKVVLASRIMYTVYLWTIKYSFSVFLRTLTESVWQRSHQRMLFYLHIFLGGTFVACIISDLAPCQPFSHLWQVTPDPGSQCRQGYAYLLTNGILNIVTNLVLVIFPIPMILKSRLPKIQKFTIIIRMALPLLNIALTTYQLPHVIAHLGAQPTRSLLASIDILLVTFTANAVVLVSLLQDRGYKKSKYKHVRELGSSDPRLLQTRSRAAGHRSNRWDSDEDLVSKNSGGSGTSGYGFGRGDEGEMIIGMEPLMVDGKRLVVEKGKKGEADEDAERERGSVRFTVTPPLSSITPLPNAKLQDITVATTWEISVEPNPRAVRER